MGSFQSRCDWNRWRVWRGTIDGEIRLVCERRRMRRGMKKDLHLTLFEMKRRNKMRKMKRMKRRKCTGSKTGARREFYWNYFSYLRIIRWYLFRTSFISFVAFLYALLAVVYLTVEETTYEEISGDGQLFVSSIYFVLFYFRLELISASRYRISLLHVHSWNRVHSYSSFILLGSIGYSTICQIKDGGGMPKWVIQICFIELLVYPFPCTRLVVIFERVTHLLTTFS